MTRAEVFTTLRSIAEVAPAGSIVIFDYLDTNAFIPEKMSPKLQESLEFLRSIGEPMITGFNPSTLDEALSNLGFHLHANLSSADIEERYFQGRTDGYHAQEQGYFACAVVK